MVAGYNDQHTKINYISILAMKNQKLKLNTQYYLQSYLKCKIPSNLTKYMQDLCAGYHKTLMRENKELYKYKYISSSWTENSVLLR